jgi:Circadian oscillating protein COP23
MRRKRLIQCINVSIMTILSSLLSYKPIQAQSTDIEFFCGVSNDGSPATMARTPEKDKPIIVWDSPFAGFTPQERCEIVSPRFQRYFNIESLPVLCASSTSDGAKGCEGELFTVRSWEDAEGIRRQLENVPWYIQGPVRQGGQANFSFDLDAYVRSSTEQHTEAFPLVQ